MINRVAVAVGACLIAVSVYLHTEVAGWGTLSPSQTSRWTAVGVLYNPCDNLSYCAWPQQAKRGHWLFSDLFTTTPHRALLFNPFFCAVGWLAAVCQTSPVLILNLIALACIPLFLASLTRIYKALGFGQSTIFLTLCLVLGGGGVSWLRTALGATKSCDMLHVGAFGPDLFYFDLYPALAFCGYPYHAVALTMLAVVAAMIVAYEDTQRAFAIKQWLLLALASAMLVTTRPYEASMLFGSYFLLALVSHVVGTPHETRRRRRYILLSLAVGLLPLCGYSFWVSTQPVWKDYAQCSFDVYGNVDWAGGFLILWVLAVLGVFAGYAGWLASARALFFMWSALCAVLLLVLSTGLTKLCGGLTIPLSVAAGVALERIFAARPAGWKLKLAFVALVVCAFASPALSLYRQWREPERMPTDLVYAQAAIQADADSWPPVVLTDLDSAAALPGLVGFRVFCGHWSLTDDSLEKAALLLKLGFPGRYTAALSGIEAGARISAGAVQRQAGVLLAQLDNNVFDYLLLPNDCPLGQSFRPDAWERPIYDGREFRVFKMSPGIRGQLAERLRAIAASNR